MWGGLGEFSTPSLMDFHDMLELYMDNGEENGNH